MNDLKTINFPTATELADWCNTHNPAIMVVQILQDTSGTWWLFYR